MVSKVKINRATGQSKELEEGLKDKYEGIFKDNNNGEIFTNDGADEDNSSDEDLDAYDGFEGDDTVSELVENSILSQSTNITGV